MTITKPVVICGVVVLLMMMSPRAARADDSIDEARKLYVAAAYDDALTMLNRLRGGTRDDGRAIGLYRALCLFALGRPADANQAIEDLVSQDPMYRPGEGDISPRVLTAISTVRRRVLPAVIAQQYTMAKAAYVRKDFTAAINGFDGVLIGLGDPDLGPLSTQPPLSDIQVLATGFRDLSEKAAEPPPPPAPDPAPAPPAPQPNIHIYSAEDRNVVPPLAIRQQLPDLPRATSTDKIGTLEVLIDENGLVVQATMRGSVFPAYDRLALNAAKGWSYRPATLDGVPVKFRKTIQVLVKPGTQP